MIQNPKWKWLFLSATIVFAILVGLGIWHLKEKKAPFLSKYRPDERNVYFESELLNTRTHEDVNGFSWVKGRVYQYGKLYTGWFRGTPNQLNYAAKGVIQPDMTVFERENIQLELGGNVALVLPETAPIVKVENRQAVSYSILYLGMENVVLSDIPGLKNVKLVKRLFPL